MVIRGRYSRIVDVLLSHEKEPVPIGFVATKLQMNEEEITANVLNLMERGIIRTEGDNIMLIRVPDNVPEESDVPMEPEVSDEEE